MDFKTEFLVKEMSYLRELVIEQNRDILALINIIKEYEDLDDDQISQKVKRAKSKADDDSI